MPVTVSTAEWPIVRYLVKGTIHGEDEIQTYLEAISSLFVRQEPYCSVIDLTEATPPSAALRRRQADWQRENDAALRMYCRGAAFVTPSRIVQGAMIAIGWIQPWPHPVAFFATVAEAEVWAKQQL